MNIDIIVLPLVAGVVGYGTNLIAIAMILRPYKAKYIGKFRIPFTPGLVHKRKSEIAKILATTINDTLLTKDTIEKAMPKANIQSAIKTFLDNKIEALKKEEVPLNEYLEELLGETLTNELVGYLENEKLILDNIDFVVSALQKLVENEKLNEQVKKIIKDIIDKSFGKVASLLFYNKVYDSIKEKAIFYLEDKQAISDTLIGFLETNKTQDILKKAQTIITQVPDASFEKFTQSTSERVTIYLEKIIDKAILSLDFKQGIEDKINEMPEKEIEALVMRVAKQELKYITLLGGLLGLLLGIIIEVIKLWL